MTSNMWHSTTGCVWKSQDAITGCELDLSRRFAEANGPAKHGSQL